MQKSFLLLLIIFITQNCDIEGTPKEKDRKESTLKTKVVQVGKEERFDDILIKDKEEDDLFGVLDEYEDSQSYDFCKVERTKVKGHHCCFNTLEVQTISIRVSGKEAKVKTHAWRNAGRICKKVKKAISILNNKKDERVGNALLELILNGRKYYPLSREGVEGNGRYLLAKYALEKGLYISKVSVGRSLPKNSQFFYYDMETNLPITALLLSNGVDISTTSRNYEIKSLEEELWRMAIQHIHWEKRGGPIKSKKNFKLSTEDTEEYKRLMNDKKFDSNPYYDNYWVLNKKYEITIRKIGNDFIKYYLERICEALLKEKQVKKLDPKYVDLVQKYGIKDQKILKELESRTS